MPLPQCPRCRGVMFQHHERETFCVVCGHVDYGVRVLQPSDRQRIANTQASRNLRKASTGGISPARNHPWRMPRGVSVV